MQVFSVGKDFTENPIAEGARAYCSNAGRNLEIEKGVCGISRTTAGVEVLLLDGLRRQLMQWLTEFIQHKQPSRQYISLSEAYSYVSIRLLSHAFSLGFESTIKLLVQLGNVTPSLKRVQFIFENVKAYSPTGSGDDRATSWMSQRNQTRHLSQFWGLAFKKTRKCFFSLLQLLVTLDDELFSTRSADNPVKTKQQKC